MKTFLVINLAYLGDVLVTSALCAEIKKHYPDSKLIFITSKMCYEVAKYIPEVDQAYAFDKRNEHKGLWGMLKFVFQIRKKWKVDCSIAVNSYERGDILAFLLGAKRRITELTKPTKFLCTDIYPFIPEINKVVHKTDINSNYLSILTGKMPDSDVSYIVPEEAKFFAKNFIKENGFEKFELIGLNPTAKADYRDWKPEQAAEFIKLVNETNKRVVITGTEKAVEFCKKLRELGCTDFLDASNKTTISRLAGIIGECKALVSVDTGSMHVGCAIKVPTMDLFFKDDVIDIWGPKNLERNSYILNFNGIEGQECFDGLNELLAKNNLF